MRKQKIDLIDGWYYTGEIPVWILHVLLERMMNDWTRDFRKWKMSSMLANYKGLQVTKKVHTVSPTGKALCLLKTQFAKKPKNPV